MTERHCGDCQLCCKLLPVRELNKGAGERCRHQKFKKGCLVYRKPGFPLSCALWNCAWIVSDPGTDKLRRPDRCHYVIDIIPDYVTLESPEGERIDIPVVQVWIDPACPDAHRDPDLRSYLAGRAEREGCAALIRFNSEDGFVLAAPCLSSDNEWHEQQSNRRVAPHSPEQLAEHIGLKMTLVST